MDLMIAIELLLMCNLCQYILVMVMVFIKKRRLGYNRGYTIYQILVIIHFIFISAIKLKLIFLISFTKFFVKVNFVLNNCFRFKCGLNRAFGGNEIILNMA